MKTNLLKKYRKYFVLTLLFSLNICINFTSDGILIRMKQTYANALDYSTGNYWLDYFLNDCLYDPGIYVVPSNGGTYTQVPDDYTFPGLIGTVFCYAKKPTSISTPVDLSTSVLWWWSIPTNNLPQWSYWDYSGGAWSIAVTPTPTPTPTSQTSPMGDPIDPVTGYPDVTIRFDNDIKDAFSQFCGIYYSFGFQVDNYGNLLQGLFTYPSDFLSYMSYFVDQVKTGSPWDLKQDGHGYSYNDLGFTQKAMYKGQIYNYDDFGNITFGVAAAAYGFPRQFAMGGAGFYQVLSGTSKWSYISSYFDDPRDSEMIQKGYDIFNSYGGCSGIY